MIFFSHQMRARRHVLAAVLNVLLAIGSPTSVFAGEPAGPPPPLPPDAPPAAPFIINDKWSMGLVTHFESRLQLERDFNSVQPDDIWTVRPILQPLLLYDDPGNFRFLITMRLKRETIVRHTGAPEEYRMELEPGEIYARWEPLPGAVAIVGLTRMTDYRNWLFASSDHKNDAIQLQYRTPTDFTQVVVATRDWVPNNFFRFHDEHHSVNYIATYEHNFTPALRVGGFIIAQNLVNVPGISDQTYFGPRLRGTLPDGVASYWADVSILRGHTLREDLKAYAYDTGALYRFTQSKWQPYVAASYARGSGDGTPGDGVDHRYRATGLQEYRGDFGGVARFKYYGEALDADLSNLAVATLATGFRPNEQSSLDLLVHHYVLDDAKGGWVAARLNRQPVGVARNAGNAVDVAYGNRDRQGLEIEFYGGFFMPGPAFGITRTNAIYGQVKLKYNFEP